MRDIYSITDTVKPGTLWNPDRLHWNPTDYLVKPDRLPGETRQSTRRKPTDYTDSETRTDYTGTWWNPTDFLVKADSLHGESRQTTVTMKPGKSTRRETQTELWTIIRLKRLHVETQTARLQGVPSEMVGQHPGSWLKLVRRVYIHTRACEQLPSFNPSLSL